MNDTHPGELLREIGEALFGDRWRDELPNVLGVSERNVRRWIANPEAVPAGVWNELRQLLAERGQLLQTLAARIPTAA